MSNINIIKNENNIDVNNPQSSMIFVTEINNLINKEDNKEKEHEYNKTLNDFIQNFLKTQKETENENIKSNKPLTLSKIFKMRDFSFENEFYNNFDIYQAQGFYKEGKSSLNIKDYNSCRLLIKENYLYILKNYNRNKLPNIHINPENSFLDKLENHNIVNNEDIKFVKYDYELSKPLLCLNINMLTCSLIINKKILNEFTILILGTKKRYSFIIQDLKIKDKFCYILGTFIYISDGYASNRLNLIHSHPKNYNLKTYITPEYFQYIAKTGDLILFQTNHILTKAQRCYTCDKYDHIALVFSNYGFISLFDASKQSKCQHHYWGAFIASSNHLSFYKVVYRRLNIEEKNYKKKTEIQDRIERETEIFLEQVKDKKYYLSICDIICKGKPKDYELNNEWDKAEGFSCSSLIAAYYIKLGILKFDKTIHSILPGDFEENKKLCFLPGFSLGPEKIIEFSS